MKRMRFAIGITLMVMLLAATFGISFAANVPNEYSNQIDWKQFSGQQIDVLFSIHPWEENLIPLIPQFEELTGIKVRVTKLPEQEYLTKVPADLTAGIFAFDVFMSQYYDAPKYTMEKWTQPLDEFMNNSKLTDPAWYDWEDFFAGARAVATIGAEYKDRIPITAEAQVLIYRKDILEKLGLKVPETFDELLATAKTIKEKENIAGITLRGGPELWWPMYGFVRSFGGEYIDLKNNASKINNPESKDAVDMYIKCLALTPPGTTSTGWDEINAAILTGKAAMFLDSSVIYSRLEDPKVSQVAGKMDIAPFVKGPAGRIAHSHYWSISMNPKAKNKEAAWLFIEWATSKQVQLQLAMKGVLSPRNSIWEDENFGKVFSKDFIESVKETLKTAVISPANMRFFEMMDILRAAVQEAFSDQSEPDLNGVNEKWQKMLDDMKAGK